MKVGIQSMDLGAGNKWSSSVDCRKELTGQSGQYWLVAVGKSPLGSAYAFTAAGYLTDPEVTHPMVTALSFQYDRGVSPPANTPIEAEKQSYTGTLTVSFDGPLYYATSDNRLLQVVDTANTSIGKTGDFCASSVVCTPGRGITLLPAITDKDSTQTDQCSSLTFKVSKGFSGATIEIGRAHV